MVDGAPDDLETWHGASGTYILHDDTGLDLTHFTERSNFIPMCLYRESVLVSYIKVTRNFFLSLNFVPKGCSVHALCLYNIHVQYETYLNIHLSGERLQDHSVVLWFYMSM